jgi:hypothetical protein
MRCCPTDSVFAKRCAAESDLLWLHRLEDALRSGACVLFAFAGDDVQSNAEAQLAVLVACELSHTRDALRHPLRRLAPEEIDVCVASRDALGRRRCATEVDRGARRRAAPAERRLQAAAFHLKVLTVVIERAVPAAAKDIEELFRAFVARVVVEEVAKALLLVGVAAGDDVDQHAAIGNALHRRGHLRSERRQEKARPERDEKLEPLGVAGDRGADQPGVLTVRAGGREHADEAHAVRGLRDLAQVTDIGAAAARGGGFSRVREVIDDGTAVAPGGEEPEHIDRAGSVRHGLRHGS